MIKILCLGNQYACDDGLGWYIYQILSKEKLPKNVLLVNIGMAGLSVLEYFEADEKIIIVDSIKLGKKPGLIYRLTMDDICFNPGGMISLHDLSLKEVIKIGELLYPQNMPAEIIFFGIEAKTLNQYGTDLSPEVKQSIPGLLKQIIKEIEGKIQ
jgi:hydrogenase maturation protease